ncbi:MAG: RsiV family protein [Lachnospiraceae bacterium]|nr:RsiV family protein [Lachnospiraceae bacterium]
MDDRTIMQKIMEAKKMDQNKGNQANVIKFAVVAAVVVGIFIILPNISGTIAHAMEQIPVIGQLVKVVTFRDYEYESDRNMADIEVPEIKPEQQLEDSTLQENLDLTTAEINAEIQSITDNLIAEFEANVKDEMGYQDVMVTSEVLATTPDYFTLKLICYQGAGSGYQWNYFYTIDLNTGERLQLKDIFRDGADYITPISENIKLQMRERMDADENNIYWLENEIEDLNFKAITDETSFYLNEKGNMVIGFNEGDVAPMYMGTVEFEIPAEVLEGIRK